MEALRKIPVVERDEGSDASREELVDQVRVELDAELIHRVITTTKRNDTRPGDREAVGLDAVFLEERNILAPEAVRIGGDITVATVQSLARSARELVPNGGTASVSIGGTLNLE